MLTGQFLAFLESSQLLGVSNSICFTEGFTYLYYSLIHTCSHRLAYLQSLCQGDKIKISTSSKTFLRSLFLFAGSHIKYYLYCYFLPPSFFFPSSLLHVRLFIIYFLYFNFYGCGPFFYAAWVSPTFSSTRYLKGLIER